MLQVEFNQILETVTLKVNGPLAEADFLAAAKVVDEHLGTEGKLRGLIIYTEKFPGWESFAALVSHLRFVREHHKKIRKVALVSDTALDDLFEDIASHFVTAQLKAFDYDDLHDAVDWIAE
jgi:hypothetical protein